MPDYAVLWQTLLASSKNAQATDFIASVSEEFINSFLEEHHKEDRDKYRLVFKRTFTGRAGTPRKFTVSIDATKPLQIYLPPDASLPDPAGPWNDVPQPYRPDQSSQLSQPNLRARAEFELELKWPKLDGSGEWAWKPGALTVDIEAFAELQHHTEEDEERFVVALRPTRIAVEEATTFLAVAMRQLHGTAGKEELALMEIDEQAFKDLLVIALNIVATEYAPSLAAAIELPTPVIGKRTLFPTFLALTDDAISFGVSLDRAALVEENSGRIERSMAALESAVEADIAAAGGFERLVVKSYDPDKPQEMEIYSPEEIDRRMKATQAFFAALEIELEALSGSKPPSPPPSARGRWVSDAMGVGFTEYLFDVIVADALPGQKSECSRWRRLGPIRGRSCTWARIWNPNVVVNPDASVSGSSFVDFGAKLEGCIKKFWDCSWKWSCSDIGVSIKGTPGLNFALADSSGGVAFRARIIGELKVDFDLPWPFDKILNAFFNLFVKFVRALLNLYLALVSFQVVPGTISLPEQKTKVKLRNPTAFYLARTPTVPVEARNRILGFSVEAKGE